MKGRGWNEVRHRLSILVFLSLLGAALSSSALGDPARENAVAVIIGNQTYLGETPDVDFAHNDADAFRRFVVENLRFDEANVIYHHDASLATLTAIFGNERTPEGQLYQWADGEEGEVIVYYSGHGVPDDEGRSYLLPVDGDPNFAEAVGYPLELLYANLAHIDAPSITVILDTCFSGRSPAGLLLAGRGVMPTPRDVAVPSKFVRLAAAGPSQIARWDTARGHGLFTAHLLDAIAGNADRVPYGNNDGLVTLSETEAYLVRTVQRASRRQFSEDQTPIVEGADDFVLAALPQQLTQPPQPPAPLPMNSGAVELAFWAAIEDSGDPRQFEAYLAKYPEGEFASIAHLKIERLTTNEVASVVVPPTVEIAVQPMNLQLVALRNANVRGGPSTEFDKVGRLSVGDDVIVTGKVEGRDWYRIALAEGKEAYIWSPLVGEVSQPRPDAAADPSLAMWALIEDSELSADFESFLSQYPNSPMAEIASIRLDELRRVAAIAQDPMPLHDGDSVSDLHAKGVTAFQKGEYRDAVDLFRVAASHGYPAAQFRVGTLYMYGRGVAMDEKKAMELFSTAADAGHPYAKSLADLLRAR